MSVPGSGSSALFQPAPAKNAPPSASIDDTRLRTMRYGELRDFLGDPASMSLRPVEVEWLIQDRLNQLQNPDSPFGQPDPSTLTVLNSELKLKEERGLVERLSKGLGINEVQASRLWKSFTKSYDLAPLKPAKDADQVVDETTIVESFVRFYMEERMNIYRVIGLLLQLDNDTDDALHELGTVSIDKIITQAEPFANRLRRRFSAESKDTPALLVQEEYSHLDILFARHFLEEQVAALELLFLLIYSRGSPSAAFSRNLIADIYGQQLGHAKPNPLLGTDATDAVLLNCLRALMIVVAIDVMHLEDLWTDDLALREDPQYLISSPKDLLELHHILLTGTTSDPHYSPILLAWSVLLHSVTEALTAAEQIPASWLPLTRQIAPEAEMGPATFLPGTRPAFEMFASVALEPEMKAFQTIEELISLPIFNSGIDVGYTALTHANALAYRAVLRGLLLSVPTLIQLSHLSSYPQYMQTLAVLLGQGATAQVTALAHQFWDKDVYDPTRGTIMTLAALRAPVQFIPLLRLLTALCGAGQGIGDSNSREKKLCAFDTWKWFDEMESFACVIKKEHIGTLWEETVKGWRTMRLISLPGGGAINKGVQGRLLSDGDSHGDGIIIAWPIRWSGWRIVIQVLREYIYIREGGSRRRLKIRTDDRVVALTLDDIGFDFGESEEDVVLCVLDLIQALLQSDPTMAEGFTPYIAVSDYASNLLVLLWKLLDIVLLRSHEHARPELRLISPVVTILCATVTSPSMSLGLWTYMRSSSFFVPGGAFSKILGCEQVTGNYGTTVRLIDLVNALLTDARRTQFSTTEESVHRVKAEVLQHAITFLLSEVWADFLTWKYETLGQRTLLGRRMTEIWIAVLEDWAFMRSTPKKPNVYRQVALVVVEAFLSTSSGIIVNPLAQILSSGPDIIIALGKAKRVEVLQDTCNLIEGQLRIARLLLQWKSALNIEGVSGLEHALFSPVNAGKHRGRQRSGVDLLQVLVDYVLVPTPASGIQLEAARLLNTVCSSISRASVPPSILGHLTDAAATVSNLTQSILMNEYCPSPIRCAIWDFASMTVSTRQAIGEIFITGMLPLHSKSYVVSTSPPKKEPLAGGESTAPPERITTLRVALDSLKQFETLRDSNASVLASAMGFLDVLWQHADEHRTSLLTLSEAVKFWKDIVSVASWKLAEDVGSDAFQLEPIGLRKYRSTSHVTISKRACHAIVKAHALHILALGMAIQQVDQSKAGKANAVPTSFGQLQAFLQHSPLLTSELRRATKAHFDLDVVTKSSAVLHDWAPGLDLESMQSPLPSREREAGDDYLYPLSLVTLKLETHKLDRRQDKIALPSGEGVLLGLISQICALNHTWCLIDKHATITRSWKRVLEEASPWLKHNEQTIRDNLIGAAVAMSEEAAQEKQSGDIMIAIHAERMHLLQAAIGAIGMLPTKAPASNVYAILGNMRKLIVHENFRPIDSFRGRVRPPFHAPLLQSVQWCARMLSTPELVNSRDPQQRLLTTAAMVAALNFVTPSLREAIDAGRLGQKNEPHADLELLVTVFDSCSRPELQVLPSIWLGLCQEMDLIRTSLDVFSHTSIGGTSTDSENLWHPSYASPLLSFHMTLARIPEAAERLAQEGALAAYTNNYLTPVLEVGLLEVVDANSSGRRSLGHETWCMIISITTALVGALSFSPQFLDLEVVSFVQLYGGQLTRALEWDAREPFSLPRLEELERVVGLFSAMSECASYAPLGSSSAAVLYVYNTKALPLLQQLNYALTHPNRLSSLLEPISTEDHIYLQQDDQRTLIESTAEAMNPAKRPVLAALLQRLLLLTRDIMSSLAANCRSDVVLRCPDPADWPRLSATVQPGAFSRVTLGEPASLGTLLEIVGSCVEILPRLAALPPTVAPASPPHHCSASAPPFERDLCVTAVRETIEISLLYTATQMASQFASRRSEMEVEAAQHNENDLGRSDRRVMARKSPDNAWRDLRGELLTDLRRLLQQSAQAIEKIDGRKGPDSITSVLQAFVDRRLLWD